MDTIYVTGPVCREVERREGKEEEEDDEITRTNVTLLSTESTSPLSIKVISNLYSLKLVFIDVLSSFDFK